MRRLFTWLLFILLSVGVIAQNYGILVNGKTFFAGSEGESFEGFVQYLAHVQVSSGDYCQLYDAENKVAWVVPLNQYSISGFTYDESNQRYNVSVSGCFDFYIKLKFNADELYIGSGSDCGVGIDISQGEPTVESGSAPAQCQDVMLQAYYWNSYQKEEAGSATEVYGRTRWVDFVNKYVDETQTVTVAAEMGQWFDLVWLPPMSKSTGGLGFHPTNYSILDSDLGTKKKLTSLIDILHENGSKVVADIVINHSDGEFGWCKFGTYDFGEYGTFSPDGSFICSTDEVNYAAEALACNGWATGNPDDGYGDEANYPSSRDWDHSSPEVNAMMKAYLKWLRNDIMIDGFRYDYCKGYHNSHINDYNRAAGAYFSVMEMWDGNVNALLSHLNDAEWNTLTFDFATKYQAFNNGIAADNYMALKGAGLLGAGKGRYAVTFLDSHDSFMRDANEFCGYGNSMNYPGKVQQCYAYMLSMPGVPCVFYPHWVTFKEPIKAMINARYKTGVHSESAVSDEAGNGYYKATIYGKNGEIRLLLGPNSGYNTTPSGYTLAVKGENYAVYFKADGTRGDKNTDRSSVQTFTVSVTCDNSMGTIVGKNGNYAVQTRLTFEAIPNEGYQFVQWSDGIKDNPRSIVVTQDITLTAEFELVPIEPQKPEIIEGVYAFAYLDKNSEELHQEEVTLHVPVAPTIAGFTFVKWQASGNLDEGIVLQAVYNADDPSHTPAEVAVPGNKTQKLIRNGNVYILTGERTYTIQGQQVL